MESKLGPLGTSATSGLSYLPRLIVRMENFGGMKIGRGNRSIGRESAAAPLCPPQIQLDKTRTRTGAARWEASD
jgi:hypothetical protein